MGKNKKVSDEYDVTERLFDKLAAASADNPNKDYEITVKFPAKEKKKKVLNKLSELAGFD